MTTVLRAISYRKTILTCACVTTGAGKMRIHNDKTVPFLALAGMQGGRLTISEEGD